MDLLLLSGPAVITVFVIACATALYLVLNSGILSRIITEERFIGPYVLVYFNVQEPHDQYSLRMEELTQKMVADARLVHVNVDFSMVQ
jgi:hypothetical protein